jgi:peptide chain release factor subunit 1
MVNMATPLIAAMGSRVAVTPLTDIDVRALAEVSSERDCFLSIYLPTGSQEDMDANEAFIRTRSKAIRMALEGEVEREFEETLASLGGGLLHEPVPKERGRVVFVSACEDFLEAYRLPVRVERTMVLDNSPYILPLTLLTDDHEDYGIILMDSREATFYRVRSTTMERVESASVDLMNRHKKGGMSQKRFNRLRRGQIEAFVDEILDDLDRIEEMEGLRGLVVAGPGEAKGQLVDALPPRYAKMLLGSLDIDMDVRHAELMAHAEELARADEVSDEAAAVEALRRAIFKDELAAVGMEETRAALARGKVATLILEDELDVKGWVCETCKCFSDSPVKCPRCGAKVSPADLVNELVEMAHRTDAAVQHVKDSPFLDSIGGVAAILRY